jgi:hypothetical protein
MSNIPETVSYYDHQEQMIREERHTNRWRIFAWVMFISFVLSNLGWIIYESQFATVTTTVKQETSSEGGGDAILNGTYAGAVINGESETDSNDYSESKENRSEEDSDKQ